MRTPLLWGGPAALTMLLAGSLAAQNMGPPPIMQVFREEVKAGRAGSHVQTEAGWPRAFGKAKIANNYIAMTTMYGPTEAWFFEAHGSVAEIDAANKAIEAAPGLNQELDRLSQADAANINTSRGLLLRFVPEASNNPNINAAEMRVWEVTIFRVRPGKEGSFFAGAKLYQSLVQQAKVDAPWATYQVMAGMPGPTFIVFGPHKTLTELDPSSGVGAAIEKAMNEEVMKQFGAISEGFLSVENMVMTPSPEMSYPTAEWLAQDPKYWGKKAAMAVKPAAANTPAPAAAPKP
jgi:hypothetical protein